MIEEIELVYEGDSFPREILIEDATHAFRSIRTALTIAGTSMFGAAGVPSVILQKIDNKCSHITLVSDLPAIAASAFHLFPDIKTTFDLVKTWVEIAKHLKGSPAKTTEPAGVGNIALTRPRGQSLT